MVDHKEWTAELEIELAELEREAKEVLRPMPVRVPRSEDTARLIESLQSGFDDLKHAVTPFDQESPKYPGRPTIWKLCRMQLSTYHRSFWFVSMVLFAMLTLMTQTKAAIFEPFRTQSMFSALLPIFLISGIIYAHRTWNAEMRMVESVTPYPPMLLLFSRYMIVFGLCVAYGFVGSLYLSWQDMQFPFASFVLQWFSLVALISGILAYVMLWKGIRVAMAASLVLWWAYGKFMDFLVLETAYGFHLKQDAQMLVLAIGCLFGMLAFRRGRRLNQIEDV